MNKVQRNIKKIRLLEPGNSPYRFSLGNMFIYDKYIRTPSTGLLTLSTLVHQVCPDTFMYSESISKIIWDDVLDADIIFISIFTFNANRGYELAEYIKKSSSALVVMGGLHASLNYRECIEYCDYILTGEGDESILEFLNHLEKGLPLDFPGLVYKKDGHCVFTGERKPPHNIETIPDRTLLYKSKRCARYNTIWLQVHASRGCPHNCSYCSVVRHFGRKVRKRSPENVVEDIQQSIKFHDQGFFPRLNRALWLTDDNFFADRAWALSVLKLIIKSGIRYRFTIQARYEVGFDDEMLDLLKKAGFIELALGIEFLEDEAYENYNKKSSSNDVIKAVKNIQKHGLNARGLFIVGADNHTRGIGKKLADFVIKYNIRGILIQSMYFIPGTPVYDQYKSTLIHENWSKYMGHVVHYPENISPYDLQKEIIYASRKIYSFRRLLYMLFHDSGWNFLIFIGESFWQWGVRQRLRKELPFLKKVGRSPVREYLAE